MFFGYVVDNDVALRAVNAAACGIGAPVAFHFAISPLAHERAGRTADMHNRITQHSLSTVGVLALSRHECLMLSIPVCLCALCEQDELSAKHAARYVQLGRGY